MTKLDEHAIIAIFQKKIGNKKFVSEDVELFNIGNTNIVAKVDTLVQSSDIPPQMSLKDAARKSTLACVSDFVSKGVRPEFAIISINLPVHISKFQICQIAAGLASAEKEFGFKIIGGDTNSGKEIVIHVCMFGKAKKISKRGGAKNGDVIFATGNFGYTSSGLEILMKKRRSKKSFAKKAINAVLKPKIRQSFCQKNFQMFSSSMDSSDGLSTTLNEMSSQSKKKFVITKLPAKKEVYEFAKTNKIDAKRLILDGGEEYEVIFTVSKSNKDKIIKNAKKSKTPILEIGHVTNGRGVFFHTDEKQIKIKDLGWKHFR